MDAREIVENYFRQREISYVLYEHLALFTVADVYAAGVHKEGVVGAKNLFLTNLEHTKYFLYVLPDTLRADLKSFALLVGEKKMQFASPEELKKYLKLTPGSVSLCGLLNDPEKKVGVYVHEGVYDAERMHLHPNVNTASMELTHEALGKYLKSLEREVSVVSE